MSLIEDPFDWRVTKAGKLIIYRGGRQIMMISEEKSAPILAKLGTDPDTDQQILARTTGQYRMGNEREGKIKRR